MHKIAGIVTIVLLVAVGLAGCGSGAADGTDAGKPLGKPSATPTGTKASQSGASATPSGTPSRTPPPSELAKAMSALAAQGFTCWFSVRSPIDVHMCYLDPGTDSTDDESVRLDSVDGSVQAIQVELSLVEQPKKTGQLLTKIFAALGGTVLKPGDLKTVREALDRQHRNPHISWGSVEGFEAKGHDYVSLTMVAQGGEQASVPAEETGVRISDLRRRYSPRGYHCKLMQNFRLECLKKKKGAIFGVTSYDSCLDSKGTKREAQCEGHSAPRVVASVAYNKIGDSLARTMIKHYLEVCDYAAGGLSPKAKQWITGHLNGEPHQADFDGTHISVEPGIAATGGANVENGIQVAVSGVNIGG